MPDLQSLHVLVVDDSSVARAVVRGGLLRMGVRHVYEAPNGNEGLAVLKNNPSISVILLDWEMPVMNGIEFTKILRQQPAYRDVHVLMITSHAEQKDVAMALASGVDDYMIKPFNSATIRARIERVLARSARMHTSRFGEYLVQEGLIDQKTLDFALECQKALDVSHFSIGAIAVINGICDALVAIEKLKPALKSQQSPAKLLEAQDFWGEIVNQEQLEQILDLRSRRRLLIGDVISALGVLKGEVLKEELDKFLASEKPEESLSPARQES